MDYLAQVINFKLCGWLLESDVVYFKIIYKILLVLIIIWHLIKLISMGRICAVWLIDCPFNLDVIIPRFINLKIVLVLYTYLRCLRE